MIKCPHCESSIDYLSTSCNTCQSILKNKDGIFIYIKKSDFTNDGFKASYFEKLENIEASSFWFSFRNKLILYFIKKYIVTFNSFMEIGCGTGFVLSDVHICFPSSQLYGSEFFLEGLAIAKRRVPSAIYLQMDARHIPIKNEIDVIGAFDVIEHINEDVLVLNQIHAALKSNGFLLLTVPQHNWLWSKVDEYACHKRRYNAADLRHKLEKAGFHILRSTSFITTLLPVMLISRYLQRNKPEIDPTRELNIPRWLNTIFGAVLSIEMAIIRTGINLPVGGSRLVIAQKVSTP